MWCVTFVFAVQLKEESTKSGGQLEAELKELRKVGKI